MASAIKRTVANYRELVGTRAFVRECIGFLTIAPATAIIAASFVLLEPIR